MAYITTAKAIRNNGGTIIKAGYCEFQNLLEGIDRTLYTRGVYGWNFDVFLFDGITLCTGYRGMVGRRVDYEIGKAFENRAAHILNGSGDYSARLESVAALRGEFAEYAKTGTIPAWYNAQAK